MSVNLGNVRSPLDLSEEEWNNVMRTNLTGTWLVSKYTCIRMRDGGRGGSVINISSIAGLNRGQLPGAAAYASSKVGLNALTRVMSCNFAVDLRSLLLSWFQILATNGNLDIRNHSLSAYRFGMDYCVDPSRKTILISKDEVRIKVS